MICLVGSFGCLALMYSLHVGFMKRVCIRFPFPRRASGYSLSICPIVIGTSSFLRISTRLSQSFLWRALEWSVNSWNALSVGS